MFCLDTNIVIRVMNGRAPIQQARLEAEILAGTRLVLPALVFHELRYGASKSQAPQRNRARIEDFRAGVPEIITFDEEDAAEAGDIRAHLKRVGGVRAGTLQTISVQNSAGSAGFRPGRAGRRVDGPPRRPFYS